MGEGATGSGGARSTEDLQEAVSRIRAELTRLSGEIERIATEQFEQRKPELRDSVNEMEAAIDSLAVRAKGFLGDLKTRLDDAGEAAASRPEGAPSTGSERP